MELSLDEERLWEEELSKCPVALVQDIFKAAKRSMEEGWKMFGNMQKFEFAWFVFRTMEHHCQEGVECSCERGADGR